MTARHPGLPWVLAAALALGACATPSRDAAQSLAQPDTWAGRLSVRVDSEPVQAFSAAFELHGDARQGRLSLYSPLGGTVAQMRWSPTEARLSTDGKEQTFDSLAALTRQAVGTELPIAGIFSWLKGDAAGLDGWVTDSQHHPGGRLVARRASPPPTVELRLILD